MWNACVSGHNGNRSRSRRNVDREDGIEMMENDVNIYKNLFINMYLKKRAAIVVVVIVVLMLNV